MYVHRTLRVYGDPSRTCQLPSNEKSKNSAMFCNYRSKHPFSFRGCSKCPETQDKKTEDRQTIHKNRSASRAKKEKEHQRKPTGPLEENCHIATYVAEHIQNHFGEWARIRKRRYGRDVRQESYQRRDHCGHRGKWNIKIKAIQVRHIYCIYTKHFSLKLSSIYT